MIGLFDCKESYYFYIKNDTSKEPINWVKTYSRLAAAKYFAQIKQLPLKEFLKIFTINK